MFVPCLKVLDNIAKSPLQVNGSKMWNYALRFNFWSKCFSQLCYPAYIIRLEHPYVIFSYETQVALKASLIDVPIGSFKDVDKEETICGQENITILMEMSLEGKTRIGCVW